MGNSGGIITYNLREGYRSESLAHFVFSAFGPCIPINREDDYGIDLLCNLADKESKMLIVKSAYGVQVKSKGKNFEFKGEQIIDWLLNLEFPLLLAVVTKETSLIEIYSTWNINRLLLQLNQADRTTYPSEINFIPDNSENLKDPSINNKIGNVPIGKPILSFSISEIGDNSRRLEFWAILNEWIEMDSNNYRIRRAGFSSSFGYYQWTTNQSLKSSTRIWFKNFFWNHNHYLSVKQNIAEAAIISANFLKSTYESDKVTYSNCKEEFNSLRQYIWAHCRTEIENFGKDLFEKDLE
jgi:hypothetical protein